MKCNVPRGSRDSKAGLPRDGRACDHPATAFPSRFEIRSRRAAPYRRTGLKPRDGKSSFSGLTFPEQPVYLALRHEPPVHRFPNRFGPLQIEGQVLHGTEAGLEFEHGEA